MAPTSPLYRLHTISYRNHRKITVIDGLIGYTGGMNIGREHLSGGEGFESWRDTQLRIVGEGAALLQAVFMVDWYNAVREDLFSPAYYPTAVTAPGEGDVPVQILTSGPDSQWAAIRQLYFSMIVTAQRHVFLQSPYFIPDASIAEALKSAALFGHRREGDAERPALRQPDPRLGRQHLHPRRRKGRGARLPVREGFTCTPRRSASIPRSARSGRRTSTSAASASTTRSMRCSTASGSRRSWRRTSSATSPIAGSSTPQSIGIRMCRSGSGTPSPGFSLRCCKSCEQAGIRQDSGFHGSADAARKGERRVRPRLPGDHPGSSRG
jgi:Phospholipase D Active site motif